MFIVKDVNLKAKTSLLSRADLLAQGCRDSKLVAKAAGSNEVFGVVFFPP